MKHILTIVFCGIAFFIKAQSIDSLIVQTERYLAVYDDFPVYGLFVSRDSYSIMDFSFTKEELITHGVELYNDSIESYYVISIYQDRILANIDTIIRHKDFPQKGSEFFISSPDNKLFNFRLFENTGGTYKSYISAIYYKENNEIIYYEMSREKGLFHSDGYESIDTIHTNSGVKYLLQGSVIGCMTCYGQYIILVRFEDGEPVCEFSYQLDTRFRSVEQFDYNVETKTITIVYETDDWTSGCHCEPECYEKTYRGNSSYDDDEYIPKYCRCVFVFNGKTFELDEYYWKKRRDNDK